MDGPMTDANTATDSIWRKIFRKPGAGGGGRAMKTALVSRYHPLLVTLHWLLAVLIIAMLCIGLLVLAPMPSTDPHKIGLLLVHMSVGMAILALMLARFIVRMRTSRPADATTGYPRLFIVLHVLAALFHQFVLKD